MKNAGSWINLGVRISILFTLLDIQEEHSTASKLGARLPGTVKIYAQKSLQTLAE